VSLHPDRVVAEEGFSGRERAQDRGRHSVRLNLALKPLNHPQPCLKIEPYVSLHPTEVAVRESYEEREQALLKRVVSLEQRLERMASSSGRPSAP
jgi:hypothetical protein